MVVVWGEGQEVGGKEGAGPAALRYFTKTISGPGLVERDRSKSRVQCLAAASVGRRWPAPDSQRPHLGLSPRQNVDTLWPPPWVSTFHPHAIGAPRLSGRAVTSGEGVPFPSRRDRAGGGAAVRAVTAGRARESLRAGAGPGGAATARRQPPDCRRPGGEAG